MRHLLLLLFITTSLCTKADDSAMLWYSRPATYWEEALPIGNGHLGAMISSAVECDTLFLNEDTFWSGSPYSNCNANALGVLDSIRQALWQKDYERAQRLGMKNIVADRNKTGHGMAYEAVGRLLIKTPTHKEGMYRRWLDLSTATAGMSYECKGIRYERTYFASLADDEIGRAHV